MKSKTRIAGALAPIGDRRGAQIIAQWVWNLRLELGHQLQLTPMRLTEFAPVQAIEPAQAVESTAMGEPAQAVEPASAVEPAQAVESPQAAESTAIGEPAQAVEPASAVEPAQATHPVSYGPPQWARPSYTKGFAGSDFSLQPDGTDAVSS